MALNGIMPINMRGQAGQAPLHLGSEGQAGLIVLLIMVVVTTVAVSVSTRSVSELRISRQEQESTRTLNLAESGIEELLKRDLSSETSGTITIASNNVEYEVEKEQELLNYQLLRGHTVEVDLTNVDELTLTWVSGCLLTVAVINGDNVTRNVVHNGCSGIGTSVSSPYTFSVSGDKALIKAVGSNATITIGRSCSGTCSDAMVYEVSSTATLADGSTRKVTVYKTPGSLPSIFDYVLFSGTSLTK
jgi:Tfp pilus assembly protein PilX